MSNLSLSLSFHPYIYRNTECRFALFPFFSKKWLTIFGHIHLIKTLKHWHLHTYTSTISPLNLHQSFDQSVFTISLYSVVYLIIVCIETKKKLNKINLSSFNPKAPCRSIKSLQIFSSEWKKKTNGIYMHPFRQFYIIVTNTHVHKYVLCLCAHAFFQSMYISVFFFLLIKKILQSN